MHIFDTDGRASRVIGSTSDGVGWGSVFNRLSLRSLPQELLHWVYEGVVVSWGAVAARNFPCENVLTMLHFAIFTTDPHLEKQPKLGCLRNEFQKIKIDTIPSVPECWAWVFAGLFQNPRFSRIYNNSRNNTAGRILQGSTIAIISAHAPGRTCVEVRAVSLLQRHQNSGSVVFMLRVKTLSVQDHSDEIKGEKL